MKLELLYTAGLFDGEGWITLCRQMIKGRIDYRYQLVVGIGMVHKPIIYSLQETYGGNVYNKPRSSGQSLATRDGFHWRLSSGKASAFLEMLAPHLIVKQDEAILAIEIQKHIRRHIQDLAHKPDIRPKLIAERDAMYLQLRAMKKRVYSPVVSDPMSSPA